MQEIVVEIGPAGEYSVTANGYRGPACAEATKLIEQALGQVAQRQPKPEYHQRQVTVSRQQVRR